MLPARCPTRAGATPRCHAARTTPAAFLPAQRACVLQVPRPPRRAPATRCSGTTSSGGGLGAAPAATAAAAAAPAPAAPVAAQAPASQTATSSSSSSSSGGGAASAAELKQQLRQAIAGLDRGIFGVPAAKRQEVAALVAALEGQNPLHNPAQHLDRVEGSWSLLYTTITITGVRKTKLGLREFIKLGDFQQVINTRDSLALNVIHFRVAGFGLFSGSLTIKAGYAAESGQRVSIKFIESTLVPDKLQQLFEKNYELLLSIFNPEGWLDITYVDDELRVGRDDKGNLFVLERAAAAAPADA